MYRDDGPQDTCVAICTLEYFVCCYFTPSYLHTALQYWPRSIYGHQHSPLVSRGSKQANYTTLIQGYVFYTLLDNVKRSDFRYFVLMFDTLGMSMLNHNNIDHINKHHGE